MAGVGWLPDEVERLLFVKAEKSGPVPVQVVALTLTFSISRPFPVSTLKGGKTMQRGLVSETSLEMIKFFGMKVNKSVPEIVFH